MKPDRIPAELRERVQWLVWRTETPKGRKPTKLPFQVNDASDALPDVPVCDSEPAPKATAML